MNKILLFLTLASLIIFSCKKDKENNPLGDGYPQALNKVITPVIIDSLHKRGVTVNSGLTPPVINGIYYLIPNYCTYDNAWTKGAGITYIPYKLQFSNQNNGNTSIVYAYKSISGTDTGGDANAFITGSGDAFTVYAQIPGSVDSLSTYTDLVVISGTIKNGIIGHLQQAKYLTSKNDRYNRVVPVGTMRIYVDNDGTTGGLSTFSIAEQHAQQAQLSMRSANQQ